MNVQTTDGYIHTGRTLGQSKEKNIHVYISYPDLVLPLCSVKLYKFVQSD